MSLRRRPPSEGHELHAGWPTKDRQPVAKSSAHGRLEDQLAEYLRGLVRGRSFLIAGHRGAGKTFLARYVAEQLHLAVFRGTEPGNPTRPSATPFLQRPLLVQIHGPSLVGAAEYTSPQRSRELAAKSMSQLMIALYRAVTTEFADAAVNQMRDRPPRVRASMLELAAQLRLDLDMGAEPARLRDYWRRLGRLQQGVLWPPGIRAPRPPGQGAAEIVALASAAQAFQICAGTVSMEQSANEGASREASAEFNLEGWQDIVNKLIGLAAGGAAAAATYVATGEAAHSLGTGVAAGLASTIGLSLTGRRAVKSERSMAYKFLPDRSLETLDRDLPVVIRRLRDAGLAPIFVIDELDKIDRSADRDSRISTMIERLKLLTTDHGFFCFLTDRDYYEEVRARAQSNGYGREHTNFSYRLLVNYAPSDFCRYVYDNLEEKELLEGWRKNPANDDPAAVDPRILESLIFARQLVHKSELNFIEMERQLGASWSNDNPQTALPHFTSNKPENLFHVIIQLAIEHVWNRPDLQNRIAEDAGFTQLATDALYMISRAWRRDPDAVLDLSQASIEADLAARLSGPLAENAVQTAVKRLRDYNINKDDKDKLVDAVWELAALLTDFVALRRELEGPERPVLPEDRLLLSQFDVLKAPGLLKVSGELKYSFRYDEFGYANPLRDGMRPGEALTAEAAAAVSALNEYVDAYADAMNDLNIASDALTAAGALPEHFSTTQRDMGLIRNRMERAISENLGYYGMDKEFGLLSVWQDAMVQHGQSAARSLQLGMAVATRALSLWDKTGQSPAAGAELSAFARQLGPDWRTMLTGDDSQRVALLATLRTLLARNSRGSVLAGGFETAAGIRAWQHAVKGWRAANQPQFAGETRGLATVVQAAWDRWLPPVVQHFLESPEQTNRQQPEFDDLVLQVLHREPSTILCPDLQALKRLDWSMLALHGAMAACGAADRAPLWALFAGLRAIPIDASILVTLQEKAVPTQAIQTPAGAIDRLLAGAGAAPPAKLIILKGGALQSGQPSLDSAGIHIEEDDMDRFDKGLAWLVAAGVIGGIFNEQ